jgi:AcrR family transcriptional regulator
LGDNRVVTEASIPSEDDPGSREPAARARSLSPSRLEKYRDEERAIRAAAFRVLGTEGAEASVQAILAEAGLSTRAFYRHFRSKDELILAMYHTEQDRVWALLSDATARAADPRAALAAWIDNFLAVAYDSRRAARSRVLSSLEGQHTGGLRQAKREGMLALRGILVEVLRSGHRDGTFPGAKPVEDARAISSIVSGIVEARLSGEGAPSWTVAREHTLGFVLPALLDPDRADSV